MKKVYLKEQLEELRDYPAEAINSISETIDILNENYGAERNIDTYLGGHIVIEKI